MRTPPPEIAPSPDEAPFNTVSVPLTASVLPRSDESVNPLRSSDFSPETSTVASQETDADRRNVVPFSHAESASENREYAVSPFAETITATSSSADASDNGIDSIKKNASSPVRTSKKIDDSL